MAQGFNFQGNIAGNQANNSVSIQGGQARADNSALLSFMAGIASINAQSAYKIGEAMDSAGKTIVQKRIADKQLSLQEDRLAFEQSVADEQLQRQDEVGKLLSLSAKAVNGGDKEVNEFNKFLNNNPAVMGSATATQMKEITDNMNLIEENVAQNILNSKAVGFALNSNYKDISAIPDIILNGLQGTSGQIVFPGTTPDDASTVYNIPPELLEQYNNLPGRFKAAVAEKIKKNIAEKVATQVAISKENREVQNAATDRRIKLSAENRAIIKDTEEALNTREELKIEYLKVGQEEQKIQNDKIKNDVLVGRLNLDTTIYNASLKMPPELKINNPADVDLALTNSILAATDSTPDKQSPYSGALNYLNTQVKLEPGLEGQQTREQISQNANIVINNYIRDKVSNKFTGTFQQYLTKSYKSRNGEQSVKNMRNEGFTKPDNIINGVEGSLLRYVDSGQGVGFLNNLERITLVTRKQFTTKPKLPKFSNN